MEVLSRFHIVVSAILFTFIPLNVNGDDVVPNQVLDRLIQRQMRLSSDEVDRSFRFEYRVSIAGQTGILQSALYRCQSVQGRCSMAICGNDNVPFMHHTGDEMAFVDGGDPIKISILSPSFFRFRFNSLPVGSEWAYFSKLESSTINLNATALIQALRKEDCVARYDAINRIVYLTKSNGSESYFQIRSGSNIAEFPLEGFSVKNSAGEGIEIRNIQTFEVSVDQIVPVPAELRNDTWQRLTENPVDVRRLAKTINVHRIGLFPANEAEAAAGRQLLTGFENSDIESDEVDLIRKSLRKFTARTAVVEGELDDFRNSIGRRVLVPAMSRTSGKQTHYSASYTGDRALTILEAAYGHSLGGGLASAASVVGGIIAHTFNAAGLHRDTLRAPDEQGINVERYPGSLVKYDNATNWIDAFWAQYDILSKVQDLSPLQDAIGTRRLMDSPFDSDVAADGRANAHSG